VAAGIGAASAAPRGADEGALEKQREISGTIATQVARLLDKARLDTENKVKMELKGIRDAIVTMDSRLDQMLAQLETITPPAEAPLDAEHVGQLLSKIEQQWGQEIRTLKEELHQTILAHNHNADLIKHHKDTIDALRERCNRMQGPGAARTAAEIQAQLSRLDALPKQQTQRKMEPLFERLTALERKVAVAAAARQAAWRGGYPGLPSMPTFPPGMRPPLAGAGMTNAAMMAAAAAQFSAAGLLPGGKGLPRPQAARVLSAATAAQAAAAVAAAAAAAEEDTGEDRGLGADIVT